TESGEHLLERTARIEYKWRIMRGWPFRDRAALSIAMLALTVAVWAPLVHAQANGASQNSSSSDSSSQQSQPPPPEKAPEKSADSKKNSKPGDPATTKLRIHVTANDKPVGNASVYVRFPVDGGLFHRDKLAE